MNEKGTRYSMMEIGVNRRLKYGGFFVISVFFIINIVSLLWYVFYGYQNSFHSDSAAQYLLAKEIVESGKYFVNGWNYVNGDIWAYYNNLFLIPFVFFGIDAYSAFALSRIIPIFLVLLGTYLVSRMVVDNKYVPILVVSIFAGGISPLLAENLYGQVSYGTYYYISCFFLYFVWRFFESSKSAKGWLLGLAVLCCLSFWTNPNRAALVYLLPCVVSSIYLASSKSKGFEFKNLFEIKYLLATLFLSSVLGVFLYLNTLQGINPPVGYVDLVWLAFPQMINNLCGTVYGVFSILGAAPPEGGAVSSISGLYHAMRLSMGVILLPLLFYVVINCFFDSKVAVRYLAVFSTVSFAVVMFFQLATSLPNMIDPANSARYLIPSLCLMLIVFLCKVFDFFVKRDYLLGLLGIAVMIVLMTSSYFSYLKDNISYDTQGRVPHLSVSANKRFAEFLMSKDLHYGYATFWNAGAPTVLSNNSVNVRQVIFESGLPVPFRWLSMDHWYVSSAWSGKSFLALSQEEVSLFDLAKFQAISGLEPVDKLSFEGKTIYVFSGNISAALPAWDRTFDMPRKFPVTESTLKQIGALHTSVDNSQMEVVAEKGEVGFVHFGPYVQVMPGQYDISFDLTVDGVSEGAVVMDVASGAGSKILGFLVAPNKAVSTTIRVRVLTIDTLEFRVFSQGTSKVIFKGVSVQRVP
ncbi:MAG: hypothetical protein KKG73_09485 [Gammaproteobacteria bacterium]|nr:hypothetical protein [Gammaproteobacteria bacterium]